MSVQSRPQLVERVRQALSIVLRRPIAASENPSRGSESGWDSLKQIELVLLLGEEFDVRFSESEMAGLDSLEHIVSSLESRLAALPGH